MDKKILASSLLESLLPFFNSQKKNEAPLDYIQVIREKGGILRKYRSLIDQSEFEILSMVKGPYVMDVQEPPDYFEMFPSLKREIKFKTIYENKELSDPGFLKAVETFISEDEEVRVLGKIPFKMYVFDEKTIMFTLEDKINQKVGLTSMFIEHTELAKGLKDIFETYWEKGITFKDFKNNYAEVQNDADDEYLNDQNNKPQSSQKSTKKKISETWSFSGKEKKN